MKSRARKKTIPPGLDTTVLGIIKKYSASRPISKGELLVAVAMAGYQVSDEKVVRDAIHILRNKQHLICAQAGKNGGYYMAKTLTEYKAFRQREYISKIKDMSRTVGRMDAAARGKFGDGIQLELPYENHL